MSISQTHSDAARHNGAQSNGPVTADGKARSSQNARKHNIFTSVALLPNEDRQEFDFVLSVYTAEYSPETPTELRLVREIADAEFRLQRIREHAATIQGKAMQAFPDSQTAAADAFETLAEGKALQLALRYERSFQRQFDHALRTLLDLRKRTAAPHPAQPARDPQLETRIIALEKLVFGLSENSQLDYGYYTEESAGEDDAGEVDAREPQPEAPEQDQLHYFQHDAFLQNEPNDPRRYTTKRREKES